uniref:Uncharacterized protein n=1 Tax=Arundo donax TaxID=35708 RepID=A0A0A9CBA0_ARUDO
MVLPSQIFHFQINLLVLLQIFC